MVRRAFLIELSIFVSVFLIRSIALLLLVQYSSGISVPMIGSDSASYMAAMGSIRENHNFVSLTTHQPNSYEMPGYPLFLAIIVSLFRNILFVSVFQNIIAGLSAVLLWRISLILSKKIAVLAVVLFAIDPAGIFYSNFIVTEPVFIFLTLFMFYFLVFPSDKKIKRVFISGLLLGAATLVRPVGEIFVPVVIIYFFFTESFSWKKSLKLSVLFSIGFLLIVGPWALRNKVLFNRWELSSVASWQFAYAHAPAFYAHQNHIPMKEAIKIFEKRVIDISPYKKDIMSGNGATLYNSPYMWRIAMEYIGAHPVAFAQYHVLKTIPFFVSDGFRDIFQRLGYSKNNSSNISDMLIRRDLSGIKDTVLKNNFASIFIISGFFAWLLINFFLLTGVIFSVWEGDQLKRALIMACFLFLIVTSVVAGGAVSHPRYRFSISPFMFIAASYGFWKCQEKILTRQNG